MLGTFLAYWRCLGGICWASWRRLRRFRSFFKSMWGRFGKMFNTAVSRGRRRRRRRRPSQRHDAELITHNVLGHAVNTSVVPMFALYGIGKPRETTPKAASTELVTRCRTYNARCPLTCSQDFGSTDVCILRDCLRWKRPTDARALSDRSSAGLLAYSQVPTYTRFPFFC